MFALISELSETAAVQVMHLWRRLNQSCGLEGIFNYPNPHFTWFSAETLEVERCSPILEILTQEASPFDVLTSGLDIFEGEGPVMYLPVIKSPQLQKLHQAIWNQIMPYGKGVNNFYSPEEWVPHITLALRDLTMKNLPCAKQSIVHETLEIVTTVETISIVKSENQSTGETLAVFKLASEGNLS